MTTALCTTACEERKKTKNNKHINDTVTTTTFKRQQLNIHLFVSNCMNAVSLVKVRLIMVNISCYVQYTPPTLTLRLSS